MEKQNELMKFDDHDKQLVRETIAKGLDEKEFNLFMAVCSGHGLNPILRQIYPVKYDGRMVFQIGIDGFRLQAERSKQYRGQLGPYWCGEDGEWLDVWTKDHPPFAAKIGILKADAVHPLTGEYVPFWGIAKFKSFAKEFNGKLGTVWAKSGDNQLAKCAEAQAIRKAFPAETSALYTSDEIWDEATMKAVHEENEAAGKPAGKPDVDMPEKNVTPKKKGSTKPTVISQIKEMLDEMKATRQKRDEFNALLKASGEKVTLDKVTAEYNQFLDSMAD